MNAKLKENNGHLCRLRLDHESVVTGFGRHDRVVCCNPKGDELYMRIDHKWALGSPTVPEMLAVARKHHGVTGRWVLESMTPWDSGTSTDVVFRAILPGERT